MSRYYALDIGRFIFAFFVVMIHIPPVGFVLLNPIAYLAVPFFYMITGFFLYTENGNIGIGNPNIEIKIKKAFRSYLKMWLIYFIIISTCSIIIKLAYHNSLNFSALSFIDQFYVYGNCSSIEKVTIDGVAYGTSALWYLYGGFLSLLILYICSDHLFKLWFALIVILVWLFYIIQNYHYQTMLFPRTIGASLPYIYTGIYIRKLNLKERITSSLINIGILFSIFLLYLEFFLMNPNGYARVLLLPCVIFIFLKLSQNGGGKFIMQIPKQIAFDIFIWHRLLFVIIMGIMGINFGSLNCIVVYSVIFLISYLLRKRTILVNNV